MKIKQGFEDAVKEATLSWEELKDQFVEFSGNEVELILKFNLPRKCKSKFHNYFSPTEYSRGKVVKRYLPESFYDEWDGKSVKHFKDLYFGRYLTQEFFEKDPISAMYLCGGWSSINGQQGLVPLEIQDEYRDLQQTVQKYKRSKRDLSRNTYQLKKQKKEKKLMDCLDHSIKSSFPEDQASSMDAWRKEGAEPIWKLGEFLKLLDTYQFRNGRIKANEIRNSEAFVVKLISIKEEEN